MIIISNIHHILILYAPGQIAQARSLLRETHEDLKSVYETKYPEKIKAAKDVRAYLVFSTPILDWTFDFPVAFRPIFFPFLYISSLYHKICHQCIDML